MSNLNAVIKAIIFKAKTPISGYEITWKIKYKTGNTHQQVYRELKKIAKRSDVLVEHVPQEGKPDKKIYSFKESNDTFSWFEFGSGNVGDYSKTKVGYELLVGDILNGTENYNGYVKAMKKAESEFLKSARGDHEPTSN